MSAKTRITLTGIGAVLLATAGCLGRHGEPNANNYLDDKVTVARIQQVLHSQPSYSYPNVQVAVTNGIVSLAGPVKTPEQRSEAASLAKSVPGVRTVENEITIAH